MIDLTPCQTMHIIDLTSWLLSQSTKHTAQSIRFFSYYDSLSDHTSLLPDKHDTLPGKYVMKIIIILSLLLSATLSQQHWEV